MDSAYSEKPLCFIHLMKTAGASTRKFLESNFDQADICPIWNLNEFEALNEHELLQYKLFCGHISGEQAKKLARYADCYTVVRDPAARALSSYLWFRHLKSDYKGKFKNLVISILRLINFYKKPQGQNTASEKNETEHLSDLASKLTFREFINRNDISIKTWIYNLTLRQLTITGSDNQIYIDQNEEASNKFVSACDFLSRFIDIGIQENLRESLELLCFARNWPCPEDIPRYHKSGDKKHIDDDTRSELYDKNIYDRKIYEDSVSKFKGNYEKLKQYAGGEENITDFLNRNHRKEVFGKMPIMHDIEYDACKAWPGNGWGIRKTNIRGKSYRFIGKRGCPVILAKLDAAVTYRFNIIFSKQYLFPLFIKNNIEIFCNNTRINQISTHSGFLEFTVNGIIQKGIIGTDGELEMELRLPDLIRKHRRLSVSNIRIEPVN